MDAEFRRVKDILRVNSHSSDQPSSKVLGLQMLRSQYHCPDCGGSNAYRSRRRSVLEKYVLPLFLLQPVRCANCFRRSNASMLATVREREQRPTMKPRPAA